MLYSDEEIKTQWDRLSVVAKREAFEAMEEKAFNPAFAESIRKQWEAGRALSPKQIAAVLKWVR